MRKLPPLAIVLSLSFALQAQEQQAGNAASTDTEGTFQSLLDKCDDMDALTLRARLRLQLPRTTEEAAGKAQGMLEDALGLCGNGKVEDARALLTEALALAEAGTDEVFATAASVDIKETSAQASSSEPGAAQPSNTESENSKPWWKFW